MQKIIKRFGWKRVHLKKVYADKLRDSVQASYHNTGADVVVRNRMAHNSPHIWDVMEEFEKLVLVQAKSNIFWI